jgi:peptidoglycan-associated lipoprotein
LSEDIMNRTTKTLLAGLTAVLLAACSSGVKLEEPGQDGAPVENRTGAAEGAQAGSASTRGVEPVTIEQKDPLDDPTSALSKRSIYFDFDSFAIGDEYRSTIDAHARYLMSHPNRRVLIQGNTDERGSREYNLALGQKRAEAVRRAMTALGVKETQMEAVSLGEERPRSTGNDDASRAENRRADLVYQ